MSLRIYVEGGGDHAGTKAACRRGFRTFFERIIPSGSFRVIASGSRRAAYDDFRAALENHQDDYIVLLVDSEEAVVDGSWTHLANRKDDQWPQPAGTSDDNAQLMIQAMEAWFLADKPALVAYYGQKFLSQSLPGQPNVELIAKVDVSSSLRHASRNTKKGEYHKTRHGFDILAQIDPTRVRAASAHANQLFVVLNREAN